MASPDRVRGPDDPLLTSSPFTYNIRFMSSHLKLRARAKAPLVTVRQALTDAAALEVWLAERAEVELPHTFAFWGRYTPDGDEPRQRLLHADDRGLRFEWRLQGVTTTVEITLEETGDDTTITVVQSHVPLWTDVVVNKPLAILGTFWGLAIANLVDHVEGRETTPKCDFTAKEMREQLTVGASPMEVFRSLMEPERFQRWFGANITVEPHVGGRWAMGDSFEHEHSVARIVDLVPGERLSLDWGGVVSTWELEGSAGRTRLTFVNSGFDETNPPHADWTGWLGGMAALRRFHELPDFRSIWLSVEWPGMGDGALVEELT
jgi:uncharacterized protein YndB with AHSA1/START domain